MMTRKDLKVAERKIMRAIREPKITPKGEIQTKTNKEIEEALE